MLLGVSTCSEKTVSRLLRAVGMMLAPEMTMRPSARLACSIGMNTVVSSEDLSASFR